MAEPGKAVARDAALSSADGVAGNVEEGARQLTYRRAIAVDATPAATFAELERLGGANGWPFANALWQVRGRIDGLVGGPGMRGGAASEGGLDEGQALDFWRVERVERPSLLRLRAEMRLPGRAWLEFEIEPHGPSSRLIQTARFAPDGIAGRVYWYGLLPIHAAIFRGLIRRLALRAARPRKEVPSDS
jgi:hypothetical protein